MESGWGGCCICTLASFLSALLFSAYNFHFHGHCLVKNSGPPSPASCLCPGQEAEAMSGKGTELSVGLSWMFSPVSLAHRHSCSAAGEIVECNFLAGTLLPCDLGNRKVGGNGHWTGMLQCLSDM